MPSGSKALCLKQLSPPTIEFGGLSKVEAGLGASNSNVKLVHAAGLEKAGRQGDRSRSGLTAAPSHDLGSMNVRIGQP